MRKLIFLSVIGLAGALVLVAQSKYKPLNVKTGLWETTWTSSTTGRPPIPDDLLAKMTPEQKAHFEAAMKSLSAQNAKPRINKSCLTKEKLEKDPFNRQSQSCKETVLASTGSRMEIREQCAEGKMQSDITVSIVASDSEHVTGTVKSNMTGGGNTMNINGTLTSKWLGPVCGNVK